MYASPLHSYDPAGQPFTNPGSNAPLYLGGPGSPGTVTPPAPESCHTGGSTYLSTVRGEASILTSTSGSAALVLTNAGALILRNQATMRAVFQVGPFSQCQAPYRVRLLRNGALVLTDGRNITLWTSQTGCQGSSRCYSMRVLDSVRAYVFDGDGAITWSSSSPGAAASAMDRLQLQSTGSEAVACIQTGIKPIATRLVAPDMATYRLGVTVPPLGAQVAHAVSGQVTWEVQGQRILPDGAGVLCLQPDGALVLWGRSAAVTQQQAWNSSSSGLYTAPGATQHWYIARVTSAGALQVLDETCSMVYDSAAATKGGGGGSSQQQRRPPPPRRQGQGSSPPAGRATRPSPTRSITGLMPPAAKGRSTNMPPPAAEGSSTRMSPPAPQTTAQAPPKSKPPPKGRLASQGPPQDARAALTPVPTSDTSTQGQSATPLRHAAAKGVLCGGIALCGADAPCPAAARCAAPWQCSRHSAFVWQCV